MLPFPLFFGPSGKSCTVWALGEGCMGIILIASEVLQEGIEYNASNRLPELKPPPFQRAGAFLPELW